MCWCQQGVGGGRQLLGKRQRMYLMRTHAAMLAHSSGAGRTIWDVLHACVSEAPSHARGFVATMLTTWAAAFTPQAYLAG